MRRMLLTCFRRLTICNGAATAQKVIGLAVMVAGLPLPPLPPPAPPPLARGMANDVAQHQGRPAAAQPIRQAVGACHSSLV